MAIKQTKKLKLSDVTELPLTGEVTLDVITRLRELRFPYPSSENNVLVFEPFLSSLDGKKQADVVLHFQAEPQEQVPAEDILDPETGEVLVPAGSQRPRIPSVAEMHAMPLPEGKQTVGTFGELFDVARRQLYLVAMQVNPLWADGVED